MSEAMKQKWVGPMPLQDFMDSFLDSTNDAPQKPDGSAQNWQTHFKSIGTFSNGGEMCVQIQQLIAESGAVPGMKVLQAWDDYGGNGKGHAQSKTTLALFSNEDLLYATTPRTQLESMELCITTKVTMQKLKKKRKRSTIDLHQGYCKKSLGLEDGKKGCARCRAELVSLAKTLLTYQHRTHVFLVHMTDPYARLIRFDRDGAIVSERFDYREHGNLLLEFLWRYSTSSKETRGSDPTVTLATASEAATAKEKLARWNSKGRDDRLVYKLIVQDQKSSGSERKKMEVLVWGPVSLSLSASGRGTKGYAAYDPDSDRIVFVKDSWRSTEPSIVKETDTLRSINAAGMTDRVPVLLCGDDLDGRWQSTVTAKYSQQKWNVGKVRWDDYRIHTRFATDKVGRPVEQFKTSKNFLTAVYDAFRAHKAVYEQCSILHCDISLSNILVTADGKGFLNDWDLARTLEDIESGPERSFRTGTWRFMSTDLLLAPRKFHTIHDDLESFFWVSAFTIMCFLHNNWTGNVLKDIVEIVFDECRSGHRLDGQVIGGISKTSYIRSSTYLADQPLELCDNYPLTNFIRQCRRLVLSNLYLIESVRRETASKMPAREREREIYHALKDKADSTPLWNHSAMEAVFIEALEEGGWPTNDSAYDYFTAAVKQAAEKKKTEEMEDEPSEEELSGRESDELTTSVHEAPRRSDRLSAASPSAKKPIIFRRRVKRR
ncbi:hypothetical protein CPC08DRAFT_699025 [Agrocybe pediades]|nr:hypothetical protein CPC08DRAFT_699025 [Agrocybe pediades]